MQQLYFHRPSDFIRNRGFSIYDFHDLGVGYSNEPAYLNKPDLPVTDKIPKELLTAIIKLSSSFNRKVMF